MSEVVTINRSINWNKIGLIFRPENHLAWMKSHAAMPIPLQIEGSLFRIYFGTRNGKNQASIGFIEIDLQDPTLVKSISQKPVFKRSESLCRFDDNSVYPGRIVRLGDSAIRMYYCGRSNGEDGRFNMAIGSAISKDNGLTFTRESRAPMLDRSEYDPWMVSTPWVIKESDGTWKMWYLSGLGWEEGGSIYHIKFASSTDGINWMRSGSVAIDFIGDETNIAAPTVIKLNDQYLMWYSYVNNHGTYRLGFASSYDGIDWERHDNEVNLMCSENGWDSQCMAYPSVFMHNDNLYLLYSGNDNGRGGIGIAKATIS